MNATINQDLEVQTGPFNDYAVRFTAGQSVILEPMQAGDKPNYRWVLCPNNPSMSVLVPLPAIDLSSPFIP